MRTIKQLKTPKYLEFVFTFGSLTYDNKASPCWKSNKDSNIGNAETALEYQHSTMRQNPSPTYIYLTKLLIYPYLSMHSLSHSTFIQLHRLRLIKTAQAPFSPKPTGRNVLIQPGTD
jgi:hypothetical protein